MKVQFLYTDTTITDTLYKLFKSGKVTTKTTTKNTYYIFTTFTYDMELIIDIENRELETQIYIDGGRVW